MVANNRQGRSSAQRTFSQENRGPAFYGRPALFLTDVAKSLTVQYRCMPSQELGLMTAQ
jgi:hypothetical protein